MTNDDRYARSKVYKLIDCNGYYYFGSTCMPLHKRFHDHKGASKIRPNSKIYTIFTTERFDNEIKIVLIEEFNLKNKEQLNKEENTYIEKHINDPFCLNNYYAILNIERKKLTKSICDAKYRESNKEKLAEYELQRNSTVERQTYKKLKHTCICGSIYYKDHIKRHEKTKKHILFINSQN